MPTATPSFRPLATLGGQSEEAFAASTTQKDDFQEWTLPPPAAKKDNAWIQPLGEMDLNTNYSREFVGAVGAPAQAIRPPARKMAEVAFEGQTTYVSDFQRVCIFFWTLIS